MFTGAEKGGGWNCLIGLTTALLIVSGCAGDADSGQGADLAVRDSAGVRIVEYRNFPPETPRAIELGQLPNIRIGSQPSEPPATKTSTEGMDRTAGVTLYRIRAMTKLSSGVIVVANEGTSQLLFFNPDGTYLRSAGRPGRGPGEFTALRSLVRSPGDSLVAHDLTGGRVSVFDSSGAFVDSYGVDHGGIPGAVRNSLFLVAGLSTQALVVRVFTVMNGVSGTARRPFTMALYERADRWTPLLNLQGDDLHRQPSPTGVGVRLFFPPYGRVGRVRAGGSRIAVVDSERYEVRLWSEDGSRLEMVLRVLAPLPRIDRSTIDPPLRESVVHDSWPAFADAWIDAEGWIWIERFEVSRSERTFNIFDRDGLAWGVATAPLTFEIMEIGADYVLGIEHDEFGVEYVIEYRFER